MADPERARVAAKWQPDGEMFPNGNIYAQNCITRHYAENGISATHGIALLERAAHAARELGPFSDKLDGFLGQVGLIAIKMMKHPLPDCSEDWAMLAAMVRG